MCGPSKDASIFGASPTWQYCRVNSTFLECYDEVSHSQSRSRSTPPPERTTAISSSTLASQAYAQTLAERAKGVAQSANYWQKDSIFGTESSDVKMATSSPQDMSDLKCIDKDRNEYNAYSDEVDHMEDQGMIGPDLTTIMLCNIPCRAKLEEITQAVDSLGFNDAYDLLHVPKPKRRHIRITASSTNIGYAFINFLRPEYAQRFMEVFDGFHFEARHSHKAGKAKFARIQGFQNNLRMLSGGASQCALPMGRGDATAPGASVACPL